MRILLAPSETKSLGGDGAPLDFGSLSLPELGPQRRRVATALVELCTSDPETARAVLGLGATLAGEVEVNARLFSSPTTPALDRFTGVLYDAVDVRSLTAVQRSRARSRLWIGSALFGLLSAGDPIPHYRLSTGCALPGLGSSVRSLWRPAMATALAGWAGGLVVDLRSGGYQELGPVPGAVTVDVVTEFPDGNRKAVSHFSKHHKGLLARALATSRAEMDDVTAMLRVARRAGFEMEREHPTRLTMVTRRT